MVLGKILITSTLLLLKLFKNSERIQLYIESMFKCLGYVIYVHKITFDTQEIENLKEEN